jgi:hypothetical protein
VLCFSTRNAHCIASARLQPPKHKKEHHEPPHFGCPHCVSADFGVFYDGLLQIV